MGDRYRPFQLRPALIITSALALIYFANCFTHLRLTNDTLRYFILTESLEGIRTADTATQKEFLPLGYVYFLLLLAKLNILGSFGICFFQLLFLAGSLWFVKKIFPSANTIWLIIFTSLNWSTLRFTITPLSEMQFLFFSTGALFFYLRYDNTGKLKYLPGLLIFCAAAIYTRTAGIILIIALAPAILVQKRKEIQTWLRSHTGYAILTGAFIIAAVTYFLMQPKFIAYLGYFFGPLISDPSGFFLRNIRLHLVDWAELFINIPVSKTRFLLSLPAARIIYMIAGIIFLVICLRKLFGSSLAIPLYVRIYIIAYILLIFNWPFFEARFWFPVLPLLAAVLSVKKNNTRPVFYSPAFLFRCYYIMAGVFVLAYYSYLSFDKRALAERHDAGRWRAEYELHFYGSSIRNKEINSKALHILNTYD